MLPNWLAMRSPHGLGGARVAPTQLVVQELKLSQLMGCGLLVAIDGTRGVSRSKKAGTAETHTQTQDFWGAQSPDSVGHPPVESLRGCGGGLLVHAPKLGTPHSCDPSEPPQMAQLSPLKTSAISLLGNNTEVSLSLTLSARRHRFP